jgi:SAM-dependent methyltransferase
MRAWKRILDRATQAGARADEAYREIYRVDQTRDRAAAVAAAGEALGPLAHCPICATTARFLPFGLDQRRGAQCPVCGSVERHRMLWLYLQGAAAPLGGAGPVLHTAPEACLRAELRRRLGDGYVGIDRYSGACEIAADLTALPFADATFGAVISSHVLEHIEDDRTALAEIGRVLRPGGRAVIMVPLDPARATYEDASIADPAARRAAFGHPFHYRIYGYDLVDRLAGAGLAAVILGSEALFSPAERRRLRINRNYLLDCTRRDNGG